MDVSAFLFGVIGSLFKVLVIVHKGPMIGKTSRILSPDVSLR